MGGNVASSYCIETPCEDGDEADDGSSCSGSTAPHHTVLYVHANFRLAVGAIV